MPGIGEHSESVQHFAVDRFAVSRWSPRQPRSIASKASLHHFAGGLRDVAHLSIRKAEGKKLFFITEAVGAVRFNIVQHH